MSLAWTAEERASALVPRRDELVRALPRVLSEAQALTDDEREFVVDDALAHMVVDHPDPIHTVEQAERIFWSVCETRIARTKDGRHQTVRAGYDRATDAELAEVADHANDPAGIVEHTTELQHIVEFAATLDETEGQVMRVKWLSGSRRPLGRRRIAARLGLPLLEVRSIEGAVGRKLDAFAALLAAGRLCDERAGDVAQLANDGAQPALAAAQAHLKHCVICKADYVAQLRAVRSADFQRKVAELLPAAPLSEAARRHGGQLRDLVADWAGRGHDAVVATSQVAASGVGRGAGGVLAVKVAAVLASGVASVGVATNIFDQSPEPRATRERATSTATPKPRRTPTPPPVPTPDLRAALASIRAAERRADRRAAARREDRKQEAAPAATAQEDPAPASPAPEGSQPDGASEFSPDSANLPDAAPAPAPTAPGSSEFP